MNGDYTPYGKVFDVGGTTARAIERLKKPDICRDHPTSAGGTGERENGNGSLMRIAPITFYLYCVHDVAERYRIVKDVSSLTHAHEISVTACFLYMEMLNHVRDGIPVQQAYERLRRSAVQDFPFIREETKRKFWRILEDDIRTLPEAEIRSSAYVIDTLEASLWCVLTTGTYRDAVLKAVNLGDDTDTTGAVTGAMAGLAYGLESIPLEWRKQLVAYEMIESYAVNMHRWDYIERLSRGLRP